MNTQPNDPAFPVDESTNITCAGLTKREHFAALAMQGQLAADTTHEVHSDKIAEWSVGLADDLIEALNKVES